ncbi:MAG: hypothetical protein Q9173_003405 [Seirophora scorigena]
MKLLLLPNSGGLTPKQMETRRAIAKWLESTFFDAVADGSIEGLKLHLVSGAHVTGYDIVIQELVRAEAPLEARDTEGATPIHDAARGGHARTVKSLIEIGADIETKEPKWRKCKGVTPLVIATMAGAEQVACVLLEGGAKIDYIFDFQQTTLHGAVTDFKSAHTFGLLLQAGANRHPRNGGRRTPLHTAASWGNRVAVQSLVDAGVKIDPVDS